MLQAFILPYTIQLYQYSFGWIVCRLRFFKERTSLIQSVQMFGKATVMTSRFQFVGYTADHSISISIQKVLGHVNVMQVVVQALSTWGIKVSTHWPHIQRDEIDDWSSEFVICCPNLKIDS